MKAMDTHHWVVVLAVVGLLSGCADQPSRETIGTGAGAVLGGAVGSQVGDGTTGAVVGGVVGALLGREVGRRLDERDREHAFSAFEANRAETWTSEGTTYTVDPTATFHQDGRLCRRYTSTINVGGEPETATGTACKRDDGTWEIVSR